MDEKLDVDALAQEIRRVDGGHNLGASQLAEALMPFLRASLKASQEAEVVNALSDIATERSRQVESEGWTPEHDDKHKDGEMARAAGIYALIAGSNLTNYRNATGGYNLGTILGGLMDHYWPWDKSWFKPTSRRRDLVKAGALIVAEIERLDRLSTPQPSPYADGDAA
ncbi:hypothetical protein [Mesorhizobium sp. NZP2298]|uniref:hypothetical protein n=1 Tax=Mesorhizobium sp. NZP2298 TaxID=2483403 RepID=UPI0015546C68|nr:hypothetical protein [Mesorhizobium sp. NZP2298]QKC99224.1 hypothetical protein EB231_35140 [Mesorhizobium sp. NZP2298]